MFRYFFLSVVLLSLFFTLSSSGQEINESKFLHVLIVGDTIDPGIGKSVEKDMEMLKNLFEKGIPESKRNVTILVGDSLTPEALFETIEKIELDPNDSFLLYYCGHGVVNENGDHSFSLPTGKVRRAEIREAIRKKNPRLCVLLSDCCAVLDATPLIVPRVIPIQTINSELIRLLFFRQSGVIDINSARRGEVALCSDQRGGLFTSKFCDLFYCSTTELTSPDSPELTWKDIKEIVTGRLLPEKRHLQAAELQAALERQPELKTQLEAFEKTRGIKVFRANVPPTRPLQHPEELVAFPETVPAPLSFPENRLGFSWHIRSSREIEVDNVQPESMVAWSGLENGDRIVGFMGQTFASEEVLKTIPQDLKDAFEHLQIDTGFDLEECLLSRSPFSTTKNLTPGRLTALVRKSSDNGLRHIPIASYPTPKRLDFIEKSYIFLTTQEQSHK